MCINSEIFKEVEQEFNKRIIFQVIFFTFTGNFKEPFVTKEITAGFKVVNYSFAVWFDWFEFVSLPLWLPGAVLAFFLALSHM